MTRTTVSDSTLAKRAARAEFATRLLIVVLVGAVVFLVVTLGQVRSTQLDGTPLGKRLAASSDRILDCTDAGTSGEPAGDCYKQGLARTQNVLLSAQRIIILAAACSLDVSADDPVARRVAKISDCVTNGLKAQP